MNKKLITSLLVFFLSLGLFGQKVQEPEFIGEVLLLQKNAEPQKLEKNTIQIKTRMSASLLFVPIGNVKSKIKIEGCCSTARTSNKNNVEFIIKAVDNNSDPLSIIKIFELDATKKTRKAELSSGNILGGSDNNLKYVKFEGKKYGSGSYLISIKDIKPGEYGIIVTNPNNKDEKHLIVSTFGIDK